MHSRKHTYDTLKGKPMKDKKHTSIVRTIKNKDHPYILLDKEPIQNTELSWKAKGILTYFMSLPDNWNIQMIEVQKHATDGTSSFRAGIHELKEAGYLVHKTLRDEKKKIIKHIYLIRENLHIGFPNIDNLNVENLTLLNNNNTKYRKRIYNTRNKVGENKNVFDVRMSKKLQKIILTKKNMNLNITQWPNVFRLLRTKNKVSKERIRTVIKWYANNIGDTYTPVAHSAKSFREKFSRLEDAMNRQDKKDNNGVKIKTKQTGKYIETEIEYEE